MIRLSLLVVFAPALAVAAPARDTCVPFADRVLAWDGVADLYVVGTYAQRAVVPAERIPPNLLELRRISTGAQLQLVNCALHTDELGADAVMGPCDYRVQFGRYIRGDRFRQQGKRIDLRRFKVAEVEENGSRGQVLMARAAKATKGIKGTTSHWQRVAWLEQQSPGAVEKVKVSLVEGERQGDYVNLVIARQQSGGDCSNTSVRMLRLRAEDLESPAASERQAHLLARLNSSSPFASWRTAAELAPLPAARLLVGMAVAEEAGLAQFAARWWQETTAQLPVEQVASLVTALRDRPELAETRQLIKLPD